MNQPRSLHRWRTAHELFIGNSNDESLRWVPLPSHELRSHINAQLTVAPAAVFSWHLCDSRKVVIQSSRSSALRAKQKHYAWVAGQNDEEFRDHRTVMGRQERYLPPLFTLDIC